LLALAYCLAFGVTRRRLMKSAALLLGAGYPAAVALAVLGDWLPMPRDDAVWRAGWPPVWRESLALVLGGAGAMARDAFLLLVVPAVLLPRPLRRLLLAWSACFVLVFANELLGARWVSLLRPGAYWRLAYLLPLPLCAGLPALSLVRDKAGRRLGTAPRLVGLLAILVTAATCQHTVFSPRNRTAWKRPGELRFTPAEAEFARLAAPFVSGRVVLAPEPVTVVLALRAPGARFYLGRFADTLHALRNVDRGDDAFRRLTARQFLDDLQPSPEREVALARAVSRGVDALVVPDRPDALRAFLIRLPGGGWGQVVSGGGYRLLLRAGTPGRMVD
jgi:hypothetical protein